MEYKYCGCGRKLYSGMSWGGNTYELDDWIEKYGEKCAFCIFADKHIKEKIKIKVKRK